MGYESKTLSSYLGLRNCSYSIIFSSVKLLRVKNEGGVLLKCTVLSGTSHYLLKYASINQLACVGNCQLSDMIMCRWIYKHKHKKVLAPYSCFIFMSCLPQETFGFNFFAEMFKYWRWGKYSCSRNIAQNSV